MVLFKFFGANTKAMFFVGAGALIFASAVWGTTSAASGWSNHPSWTTSVAEQVPTKGPAYPREARTRDISPFAPGSNNLAVDVGQVFLMGDLSKYSNSIGSQIHYTYGVSDVFGFDSSVGYSSHAEGPVEGRYSMTTLLAGVRTNLSWYDKVVPNIVFGLGFYRPSYQLNLSSVSPLLFGLHLGPGVDLELTRNLFFGAALTFHDIFGATKITAEGPVNAGGTYTSFFLRAGVSF